MHRPDAKRTLMKKLTDAIGDTLIFLRVYPAENVAMDEGPVRWPKFDLSAGSKA
jgi:hypothetical protein